jgi:hypothetical protein
MFKVGDTVVCIDNIYWEEDVSNKQLFHLTVGKSYVVDKIVVGKHIVGNRITDETHISVKDDRGEFRHFLMSRFVLLLEYRKMKLEKICSKKVC